MCSWIYLRAWGRGWKGQWGQYSTREHMQINITGWEVFSLAVVVASFQSFLLCFSVVSLISLWSFGGHACLPASRGLVHWWARITHLGYTEELICFFLAQKSGMSFPLPAATRVLMVSRLLTILNILPLITISVPQLVNYAFGCQAQEKMVLGSTQENTKNQKCPACPRSQANSQTPNNVTYQGLRGIHRALHSQGYSYSSILIHSP